jgi:hypothetical protein
MMLVTTLENTFLPNGAPELQAPAVIKSGEFTAASSALRHQ